MMLRLADRPALGDLHSVALAGVAVLIVHVKRRATVEVLAVLRMLHLVRHRDLDGLGRLGRGDRALDLAKERTLDGVFCFRCHVRSLVRWSSIRDRFAAT